MSFIVLSFLAAVFVMAASLVGVAFAHQAFGMWMRERLTYLATFSAGVLLVLAYHLIEESFYEGGSLYLVAGSIVAGVVVLEILHRLLPHDDEHHHHGEVAEHAHTPLDGRKVLLSDSIHNITDGFLIVPAFLVDWKFGIAATVGIFFHELVQEISEFFILKEAGYSNKKALIWNFAASSTILIGVVLALTLTSFGTILAILGGFAAGGFLSVVIRDLLPHAISSAKVHDTWLPHLIAISAGLLLMIGITTLMPHEEIEHEEGQEYLQTIALRV